MTLQQTIEALERAARLQPSVGSIVQNDVFRLNSMPDAKYGVFAWTQQQHVLAGDTIVFAFALFYVDRLTEDAGNEVEIQSTGVATLSGILRRLEDDGVLPLGDPTFETFNQRFADECAGVWCSVRLEVPVTYTCPDDLTPASFNPDFNNDFNKA